MNGDGGSGSPPALFSHRGTANLLLPALGLLGLALFAVLLFIDRPLYNVIIDLWSFEPQSSPFVDVGGPLAWLRAWRHGVDVYLTAPDGAHGWRMNYSPLLLRLPLPTDAVDNTPAYGLGIDLLFMVSLAVLPRPRVTADYFLFLLAVFSPFCIFGVERANIDLLIFAMVAFGLAALGRGAMARLIGYTVFFAAGMLKFYPFVLLTLLLRERRMVCLLGSAVAAAILAAFAYAYHDELARIPANLPVVNPFKDSFGAYLVPTGLVLLMRPFHAASALWVQIDAAVWLTSALGLHGAALIGALRLGRSAAMQRALLLLSARESMCLAVGTLLVCGCFFAGASIGYRAVLLLFALPGMLALSHVAPDAPFARRIHVTVVSALFVLWSLPAQRLIATVFGQFWIGGHGASFDPPTAYIADVAFWLLREAMWWWLITFLLAIVVRSLLDSQVWSSTVGTWRPRYLRDREA